MNQPGGNIVDTTDCLEAISVFRCWKNLLFAIVLVCLLLLQLSFWAVNRRWVGVARGSGLKTADANAAAEPNQPPLVISQEIAAAAREVAADVNVPGTQAMPEAEQPQESRIMPLPRPDVQDTMAFVKFIDFVLVPAATLYCLTLLFALKVSLIGRLGGINHIARAFFLSLIFLVLLLPWQVVFGPLFKGIMFMPGEMVRRCAADKDTAELVFFYARFVGYWLVAVLLLALAQIRSIRWTLATLKRLDVI